MRKRILIIVVVLALAGLAVLFAATTRQATVDIEVSPGVASLKLDNGKTIHTGNNKVSIGNHTVTASFAGFATQKVAFTAASTPTPQKELILLLPNSPEGQAWLSSHPSEQDNRQKIGGEQFSKTTSQAIQKNPLITQLPYQSPDGFYRVDYGGGDSSGGNIQYYVTYENSSAKSAAQSWISSQKVDPNTLNIKYIQDSLLPTLPYTSIDFGLTDTSPPGTQPPQLTAKLNLSQADMSNKASAEAGYKQEVTNYITSVGADPNSYVITFEVNSQ